MAELTVDDVRASDIARAVRVEALNDSKIHMQAIDHIAGYDVRPGFYEINGATAIPVGVNFTIHSNQATSVELLLFRPEEETPFADIKFPHNYRIGNVWSMIVFGVDIETFEYAYKIDGPYNLEKGQIFDKTKVILDPYARAITGQSVWGTRHHGIYKARVVKNNFDWGNSEQPNHSMEDLVIYELHVRGFTKDPLSGVIHNGTFAGVLEKLQYLKDLGINAIEMMPIFEFDEMLGRRDYYGRELMDYWGYNTVGFFAPNTSYTSVKEEHQEGTELKEMIRIFHENNIEVILDVVFNHTAEGNESGPFFSFKGIDNNIYYMLTPEGYYYNFSGCGNTLNCNHPIVQQLILDCLRYWVTNYHIDGFRFDLATILGRNEDGSPMEKPPLLQSLAFDPILGRTKLIAEAWDAGGLYQVGTFPSWSRWSEWNGRFRDDMRSFLKGDNGRAAAAVQRMMGSRDIYQPEKRGYHASVNFLTCHDGFTLHDLYTYNEKHNEDNNWNNTDGANDNLSWNCGFEGETTDPEIRKLRRRMIRNAFAVLLTSRGTPMFFMGDEFGNSQSGNNNAYCQDNYLAWLRWRDLRTNRPLHDFVRYLINFRTKHRVLRSHSELCSLGYPELSAHGVEPWNADFRDDSHFVGVMFAGRKKNGKGDDVVYVAVNTYWEALEFELPGVPEYSQLEWFCAVDTYNEEPVIKGKGSVRGKIRIEPRTVMIFFLAYNT